MNAPQGLFSFGSVRGFISATFTLSHGTDPSKAFMYIPPDPRTKIPEIAELKITFGRETISFPDCRFERMTFEQSDDGRIVWGLVIQDTRWRWRFGSISGFYNITVGDRVKKVRQNTLKSPQELFKLCFDALGIPPKRLNLSQVPNDARPQIAWEHERIDHAINQLCQTLGCRCILLPGNMVAVVPQGQGRPLPVLPYTSYQTELEPPLYSDSILFVGAPVLREIDIELEPIGEGEFGRIYKLDDLPFKPVGGWGDTDLDFFNDIKIPNAVGLARKSVFRMWRPKIPFTIPATAKLNAGHVGFLEQILPMLDHQVTREYTWSTSNAGQGANNDQGRVNAEIEGEKDLIETEKPMELWGLFYNNTLGQSSAIDPEVDSSNFNKAIDPATVKAGMSLRGRSFMKVEGFQLDRERGIIYTDDQLFQWEEQTAPAAVSLITGGAGVIAPKQRRIPAKLFLRVAVQVRILEKDTDKPENPLLAGLFLDGQPGVLKSRAWRYSTYTEKLRDKPLGIPPQVIKRDDCGLESRMTWSAAGEVKYSDNFTEFNEKAKYYVDAVKATIKPGDPSTANYAGIYAQPPDGAVFQVTWHVTDDGFCFTRMSRNREESLIVPSYESKLMIANIKEQILKQQAQTGKPKK